MCTVNKNLSVILRGLIAGRRFERGRDPEERELNQSPKSGDFTAPPNTPPFQVRRTSAVILLYNKTKLPSC